MAHRIKITRTSTKTYKVEDQDLGYYIGYDVLNVDQAALHDLKTLEDDDSWDDIDPTELEETTYEVVLLDEDDNEIEPNPLNTQRDLVLFPEDESTDDSSFSEKPVKGDLNAGSTLFM